MSDPQTAIAECNEAYAESKASDECACEGPALTIFDHWPTILQHIEGQAKTIEVLNEIWASKAVLIQHEDCDCDRRTELQSQIANLEAQVEELQQRNADIDNAICWETTCIESSKLLDKLYPLDMDVLELRAKVEELQAENEQRAQRILEEIEALSSWHKCPSSSDMLNRIKDLAEVPLSASSDDDRTKTEVDRLRAGRDVEQTMLRNAAKEIFELQAENERLKEQAGKHCPDCESNHLWNHA